MKIALKILFLLIVQSICAAQSKFQFGPRLGYQFSNFTGEKHSGFQPGFYGGGFAKYALSPSFEVEADVLYSETGGLRLTVVENPVGLDDPITRQIITSHTSLKGMEFPFLLHYYPWTNSVVKPYLSAGPSLGILIYGRAQQDITFELNPATYPPISDPTYGSRPATITSSGYENVTSAYNRYNMGGVIGMGLAIPFSHFSMRLDLRYRRSLTAIDTSYDPMNLISNSSNLKSNSIALSVAVIF